MLQLKLLKVSFFSAIITFIRISSGFVAGKIVALFVGPSGIALIGQFSNFISIVLTFSNGAINNGVIKYTAEYNDDENNLKTLLSTALRISIYFSGIVGLILIFFSRFISRLVFNTEEFYLVLRVFGATITFYSLNTLLVSILNGKGDIRKYTIVNTIGVLVGLALTCVLVYFYKIQGALFSLILSQSIVFFVTIVLISKSNWFRWSYFTSVFDNAMAKKLGGYSLMALASVLTIPVSQMVLRNMVIAQAGITSAGYWQGMMRISDGYLMLITTSLSTYFLPKLSSLKTDSELQSEIFKSFKIVIPLLVLGCAVIYVMRFFIINLLYTEHFVEMEKLFLFQLLGDILKIASWLIGYVMVAKAMTKAFIFTEVFFNITYIIIGYLCVKYFGLRGISFAFFLNYLLCLFCFLIYFRKLLFSKYE